MLQHATLSFCAGHERNDPSGRSFSSALHHLQTVFFLHAARESRQRGVKGQSKSFYESRIFSVFGVRIGTLRTHFNEGKKKNTRHWQATTTIRRKTCSSRKDFHRGYFSYQPCSSFSSLFIARKPPISTSTTIKISTLHRRCVKPTWKRRSKNQKLRSLILKRVKSWKTPLLTLPTIHETLRGCTLATSFQMRKRKQTREKWKTYNSVASPNQRTVRRNNLTRATKRIRRRRRTLTSAASTTSFVKRKDLCGEKMSFQVEEDGDLAYEGRHCRAERKGRRARCSRIVQ